MALIQRRQLRKLRQLRDQVRVVALQHGLSAQATQTAESVLLKAEAAGIAKQVVHSLLRKSLRTIPKTRRPSAISAPSSAQVRDAKAD